MTKTKKLFSITLVCKECGCRKEAIERTDKSKNPALTVPIGDCQYCEKDFGWYFYPGQKILEDRTLDNSNVIIKHLEEGDIVTINTKLHVEDPRRIYSIERKGKLIYAENS